MREALAPASSTGTTYAARDGRGRRSASWTAQATPAQIGGLLVALAHERRDRRRARRRGARHARSARSPSHGGDSIADRYLRHRRRRLAVRSTSRRWRRSSSRRPAAWSPSTATARSRRSAGSHDVLEALGLDPAPGPETAARCLREAKLAFLFAPRAPRGDEARRWPAQGGRRPHAVQPAGAAHQPVRGALSRQRHLQPRALRAAGPGARGAGVVARHGRSRRRWPGRVRAGRRHVRRRAHRRQGAQVRAEAVRLRPGRERSGRLAGRLARRQRAHRARRAGRRRSGRGSQRDADDGRRGHLHQRRGVQSAGGDGAARTVLAGGGALAVLEKLRRIAPRPDAAS